jgi:hypothetical protein
MLRFFKNVKDIERFLGQLQGEICPFCGARALVRHGYVWGAISPGEYGIRAWRIFCDPDSPRGNGCGRAPSIRLSETLSRRCFSANALWMFIQGLRQNMSVRAAWRYSRIALSMRSGYRLFRRLGLCLSVLRTHLHGRAPPLKTKNADSPLFETFDHLEERLGNVQAISAYQEILQRDFLAIS